MSEKEVKVSDFLLEFTEALTNLKKITRDGVVLG